MYRLDEGENWTVIGGGDISIGKDRKPTDRLAGTFTMQLKENQAIDFNINAGGRGSFKTEEIPLDAEAIASITAFLQEYREITLNEEIPVALMVYDSGARMRSCSLQDYFEPSRFEGMDLVQAVTLEFLNN